MRKHGRVFCPVTIRAGKVCPHEVVAACVHQLERHALLALDSCTFSKPAQRHHRASKLHAGRRAIQALLPLHSEPDNHTTRATPGALQRGAHTNDITRR